MLERLREPGHAWLIECKCTGYLAIDICGNIEAD
jgi:hypothetical protein